MRAIGFIADPLRHFDTAAETTLFLMREAMRRGYRILVCEPGALYLQKNEPWATMQEIVLLWPQSIKPFYRAKAARRIKLSSLSGLFLRKDPPFNLPFLHHLYILAPLSGRHPIFRMINDPVGIMEANEKLVTAHFPHWMPETIVAASATDIIPFIKAQRHGAVLKPLHAGGGRGVRKVERSARGLTVILNKMTAFGTRPIVCQEFLPGVRKGDKRILLAGAKPLGAFVRIARPGEFRANLHQGGSFHKAGLTKREERLIAEVGPFLTRRGLLFSGLDVIDGKLTEINVTSPMGIRELNATQGGHAERRVFDCAGF